MRFKQLASWLGLVCSFGGIACSETDSGGPRVHTQAGGSAGLAGAAGDSGAGGTAGSSGAAGSAGAAGSCGAAGAAGAPVVSVPWDWVGIIGTGQSLAVGQYGTPVKLKTQPANNMKLSTGSLPWPIDPNDTSLTMVPLIEPVGRLSTAYPSQWPTNIAGETPHSAMANQISALVQAAASRDYLTVHGEFGENGQCMTFLAKGAMPTTANPNGGRAFEATTIEVQAVQRLAAAAGKSYGIGAIMLTHGECDAGNPNYESDMVKLWTDYNTDLSAITGQTQSIQMLVSQQNSVNDRSASTLAQWQIGVDHPNDIVCIGPKYQYPYYSGDGVHLITDGYELLGEKYAEVYYERVVLGRPWQPLQPTSVERSGRVITVHFHVPVPPLAWDDTLEAPHSSNPAWQAGKGFEVNSGSTNITISSVDIACDSVQITCATDLPATVTVSYATLANATARTTPLAGSKYWGQLRDSDPFVGAVTAKAQPNYAVAFSMPVP